MTGIVIAVALLAALAYLLFALYVLLPAIFRGAPSSPSDQSQIFEYKTGPISELEDSGALKVMRRADLQTRERRESGWESRPDAESEPPMQSRSLREAEEKIKMLQELIQAADLTAMEAQKRTHSLAGNGERRPIEPDPYANDTQLSLDLLGRRANTGRAREKGPSNDSARGANSKIGRAMTLYRQGLSKADIAREMGMGMAEVELLIALEKKKGLGRK